MCHYATIKLLHGRADPENSVRGPSQRFFVLNSSTHCTEGRMCGSRGGGARVRTPAPLKNHKNIGYLSDTGPDPLKNKAAEPAFNGGPSSARQRNAI